MTSYHKNAGVEEGRLKTFHPGDSDPAEISGAGVGVLHEVEQLPPLGDQGSWPVLFIKNRQSPLHQE